MREVGLVHGGHGYNVQHQKRPLAAVLNRFPMRIYARNCDNSAQNLRAELPQHDLTGSLLCTEHLFPILILTPFPQGTTCAGMSIGKTVAATPYTPCRSPESTMDVRLSVKRTVPDHPTTDRKMFGLPSECRMDKGRSRDKKRGRCRTAMAPGGSCCFHPCSSPVPGNHPSMSQRSRTCLPPSRKHTCFDSRVAGEPLSSRKYHSE